MTDDRHDHRIGTEDSQPAGDGGVVRFDCARFEDALAESRQDAWTREHRLQCPRCDALADATDALLDGIREATAPVAVPAGFADAVFARAEAFDPREFGTPAPARPATEPSAEVVALRRWRTMALAAALLLSLGAAFWAGQLAERGWPPAGADGTRAPVRVTEAPTDGALEAVAPRAPVTASVQAPAAEPMLVAPAVDTGALEGPREPAPAPKTPTADRPDDRPEAGRADGTKTLDAPWASPDQTAPDQTAPDQTAPDQTAPDQTVPAPQPRVEPKVNVPRELKRAALREIARRDDICPASNGAPVRVTVTLTGEGRLEDTQVISPAGANDAHLCVNYALSKLLLPPGVGDGQGTVTFELTW